MDAKDTGYINRQDVWVSIHAPVMDANSGRRIASSRQSFNPRARDGRETGLCNMYTRHSRFNPRARDGREDEKYRIIMTEL